MSGTERLSGTVRKFDGAKGWGFLTPDDKSKTAGKDVFVHYSGIVGGGYKSLDEGDKVEFEVIDGPKGKQAAEVVKL